MKFFFSFDHPSLFFFPVHLQFIRHNIIYNARYNNVEQRQREREYNASEQQKYITIKEDKDQSFPPPHWQRLPYQRMMIRTSSAASCSSSLSKTHYIHTPTHPHRPHINQEHHQTIKYEQQKKSHSRSHRLRLRIDFVRMLHAPFQVLVHRK